MKKISDLINDFQAARRAMDKVSENLPRIIGIESKKIIKENFKLGGYDSGTGVTPWEKRKEDTDRAYDRRSGVKGSVYNSGSPVLMQTRNLYNSIKYSIASRSVTIGVNLSIVPYAEKMNEGGPGKWGKFAATETVGRKYMPSPNEPPNAKILIGVRKKILFETEKALLLFKK